MASPIPEHILNWINNAEVPPTDGAWLEKRNPRDGTLLCHVARSQAADVELAIAAAQAARETWGATNVVRRGDLMRAIALRMRERKSEIASIVSLETGKSMAEALGETDAAIEMGFFVAGEGRRYYGRTTTASMDHRTVMTQRMPLGVAGLVIASNTPIANVAWKAFPSMLCGNASILKPSEDTPATARIFAECCADVGIPDGVFNVVQGLGAEAGAPLVESPAVDLVSFTGSCGTGRIIQCAAGARLAKVCMELGGKNALVVCDDADLDNAERWVLASAFSNAGQRCAAASRILVFDAIYADFRDRLAQATAALKVGPEEDAFLGPVINETHLNNLLAAIERAKQQGARVLAGGQRLLGQGRSDGCFLAPTLLEGLDRAAETARTELFGPVATLFRVADLDAAIALANDSDYGLTASIHTASIHRAMTFARRVETGVVVVNGGTHGSEPHMGFGGVKSSGTGWREAGVEALDVYSDWKYVNLIHDPSQAR
jgi:aldehyde dehydrogenase (NAD+)